FIVYSWLCVTCYILYHTLDSKWTFPFSEYVLIYDIFRDESCTCVYHYLFYLPFNYSRVVRFAYSPNYYHICKYVPDRYSTIGSFIVKSMVVYTCNNDFTIPRNSGN